MRFEHIISIGYFCSVAIELERKGFREASFPFDWTITDLDTVTDLIAVKFENLFAYRQLFSNEVPPFNIVGNYKFNILFYHDFKQRLDIKSQLKLVKIKYTRRIKRLLGLLNSQDSILFIRYISEESKKKDTQQKINRFINVIKKIHPNFKIILIGHQTAKLNFKKNESYILGFLEVPKGKKDILARDFFNDRNCYKKFNQLVQYPIGKRIKNLFYYHPKNFVRQIISYCILAKRRLEKIVFWLRRER